MFLILELMMLSIWLRKKQYRFIPLSILLILYTTLCYLTLTVSKIMQDHQTLFSAVEVIVLAAFLTITVFLSIKPHLQKCPICLATAAGVCRIARIVYSRWLLNYIRQFLGNVNKFEAVLLKGILVSNVLLWITQFLCLAILLCFLHGTRGRGDGLREP